jgi:hypothetical protein
MAFQVYLHFFISFVFLAQISHGFERDFLPPKRRAFDSELGNFSRAAVSIDSQLCASIGK